MAAKSAFAGDETIKKHLKEGTLKPVYVFFGEEGYLRRHYTGELLKLCGSGGFGSVVFGEKGFEPGELLDAVYSVPFFGGKKAVLVKNLEPKALKGRLLTEISRAIPEIPPETTLVFTYEDPERVFPNGADEKKLCALVQAHGEVIEFRRPGEKRLSDWVSRRCALGGKAISPGAVSHLLACCRGSMDNLMNETDKLINGVAGGEITTQDIDRFCARDEEAKIYRLADLFLKNDMQAFLNELSILIADKTEPVFILSAFSRAIESAQVTQELTKKGMGAQEIAKITGQKEFAVKNLQRLRGVKEERLKKVLTRCVEADLRLKSSRLPPQEVLQNCLTECFFL